MTEMTGKPASTIAKELLTQSPDVLREIVRAVCLRLVRSLAVETHENWLEAHRYLNMDDLKEQKKTELRQAA